MKTLKKELFFTIAFSLITLNSNSQTKLLWGKQFGTEKNEYIMNHVIDLKGNIYVSGTTSGNMDGINNGQNDGFLIKMDSSGNEIWTKQFGTVENEDIQWSAIDSLGNVYITGSTKGNLKDGNRGAEDIFIIKYNSEGQMMCINQFGSDTTDIGKGVFADNKGNIYLTGVTSGKLGETSYGNTDGFIIKIDADGSKLFTYQFGTSSDDFAFALTGDNNSKIYVCGSTTGDLDLKNKGFFDGFVLIITDEGKLVNNIQFGSEGFDIPMAINVDNTGNIYIGGSTSGNYACDQIGEGDCFLTKIGSNGNIIWNKQFGTPKNDGIRSIEINNNVTDNILVSGVQNLPPAQAFIRMYSKSGDSLWEKNFKDEYKDADASGKAVSIDDKGNIIHSGLTQSSLFSPLIGEADFYILKLSLIK